MSKNPFVALTLVGRSRQNKTKHTHTTNKYIIRPMEKNEVDKDNKEGDSQGCNLKWDGQGRLTWKMEMIKPCG